MLAQELGSRIAPTPARTPAPLPAPLLLYAMDADDEREFVLRIAKHNGRYLRKLSEELRADREVVLAAATHDSDALPNGRSESYFKKSICTSYFRVYFLFVVCISYP